MISIRSAFLGGFVSTVVVSCMLIMKNALKAFPDVHIPQTISTVFGTPDHVVMGGIAFFVGGTVVLSLIYAAVERYLPGELALVRGLLFGFLVWLGMMLIMMPLAGAGIFALNRSATVPAVELVIALIYGLL